MLPFLLNKELMNRALLSPVRPMKKNNFDYSPVIGKSRTVEKFFIGDYQAELKTDIESVGPIEYKHILAVTNKQGEPVLFTAAEVNSMAKRFGREEYFFGLFTGSSHGNLGSSNDWADLDKFTAKSIEIVKSYLNIQ